LNPCAYEVFDSESALELNPEVVNLTPGHYVYLFKNSNLKISLKTENTIGKLLTNNRNNNPNKLNKSDIYQLTHQDCNGKYNGHTGRPFHYKVPRTFS
jgi:hypothetical protein